VSRQKQHLYNLRHNKNINKRLQSSFNKYGEEAFEFSVVEELNSTDSQKEREQYWMNLLNPQFNHVRDVGRIHHPTPSEEVGKKISIANTGKKRPQYAIDKVAEFHRGRKRSEETCRKIAEKAKNRGGIKGINAKPIVRINLFNGEVLNFSSTVEAVKSHGTAVSKVLVKNHLTTTVNGIYHWLFKHEFDALPDVDKYIKETKNEWDWIESRRRGQKLTLNIETGIYYNSLLEAHANYQVKIPFGKFSKMINGKRENVTPFILV